MSKKTDVIVIGSGIAGLMAALAARQKGCRVRVLSYGAGCLAISPGTIDLLGYDILGRRLENPWSGMSELPATHPYRLLGQDKVSLALNQFVKAMADNMPLHSATSQDGEPANALWPTVAGTLKPTWLYQSDVGPDALAAAKKILVLTVTGFRDCRPSLIISQLRRYSDFADKEFAAYTLPSPFDEKGRSLNALDLAHVADREEGREWFLKALRGRGNGFDLALAPPMLGVSFRNNIRAAATEALGCPIMEMVSVPPGVGGLRIRQALVSSLLDSGVDFFDKAKVAEGHVDEDGSVHLQVAATGRHVEHQARACVVATGGIISGGVVLSPGEGKEAVFGVPIPLPENVEDWSQPDIFGQHIVTSLGVVADERLRAVGGDGNALYPNVFFAGRTLGGYDYAAEKSGHGVAIATGWHAGSNAADFAKEVAGEH